LSGEAHIKLSRQSWGQGNRHKEDKRTAEDFSRQRGMGVRGTKRRKRKEE
jgi:hypothetical protein